MLNKVHKYLKKSSTNYFLLKISPDRFTYERLDYTQVKRLWVWAGVTSCGKKNSIGVYCSPDLNHMDFSIRSILESKVGVKKYNSIDSLKQALKAVWNSIEPETVRKCCADARCPFEAVIEADGGYFE